MSVTDKIKLRLEYLGGDTAGRMNLGKLRSFEAALRNSYQATKIIRLDDEEEILYPCLINPDKVDPDYDNKVISINYKAGLEPGDTFYWPATNTYWIIYLQEINESAYFRGYIRHCEHKITINDIDYYVYVKGPTETNTKWSQKEGVVWNQLNGSIFLYVKKNEDTLNYFKRSNIIELNGQNWRVEATDSISMSGIIEVNLGEYFNNPIEELQEIPVVAPVDTQVPHIVGEPFVKPYDTHTYTVSAAVAGGTWEVSNNKATIQSSNENEAVVEVVTGRSGSFDLIYHRPSLTNLTLTIIIESL